MQERGVLYTLRNFARFRRNFYIETVAGGLGYLGLLQQLQNIRNAEENLEATARNLAETEELVAAGLASRIQRDQVSQQYQSAQLVLVSQEASLQTNLDLYRTTQLGLPPELPVTLDDTPLRMFELNDPRLQDLRRRNDVLYLSLLQPEEPPPVEELAERAEELLEGFEMLRSVVLGAQGEFDTWRGRLGLIDDLGEVPLPPEGTDEATARQIVLALRLGRNLQQTAEDLEGNLEAAADLRDAATVDDPRTTWEALQALSGAEFRKRYSELFVTQAQVRVFLIELTPVNLELERAVQIALENRLDLMNSKAQVTDAWRNVEVAGNALLADLNLRYSGTLATDPGLRRDLPVRRLGEQSSLRDRV